MTYGESARKEWGCLYCFWRKGWDDRESAKFSIPRYSEGAIRSYKRGYDERGETRANLFKMLTEA